MRRKMFNCLTLVKLRVRHYFLFFKFNRHQFWLHWHGSWYQLRHIVDARNRRVIDEGWSKAMCAWKGNGIKNVSKMGGVISIFLLLFIYMSFFFTFANSCRIERVLSVFFFLMRRRICGLWSSHLWNVKGRASPAAHLVYTDGLVCYCRYCSYIRTVE